MPESQNEEYKESWRDEYLKQISSFANAQGGKLYIGIDDKERIIGLPEKDSKKLLEDLPNKIRSILGISPEVNLLKHEEKKYIEIIIAPSSMAVSYKGQYYIRIGSVTHLLEGNALSEFLLGKSGQTWDNSIEDRVTIKDIDEKAFNLYIEAATKTDRLPDVGGLTKIDILERLRLIEDGKFKRAAIILFGKDPGKFIPGPTVKIGRFGKDDADLMYQEVIESNLIITLERVLEQLDTKFLTRPIKYEGIQRIERSLYPIKALREAILNALVHRDYMGANTLISVYDDKLMIWNDGGLPRGFSIEALKGKHGSKPRNPVIAEVCYKAGYIESWGRGTLTILQACEEAGLPEPSFVEKDGGFMVTLFNGNSCDRTTDKTIAENEAVKENEDNITDRTTDRTNKIQLIIDSNFDINEDTKKKLFKLLRAIVENEGKRQTDYKDLTDIKAGSLARYMGQLVAAGLIEFRGKSNQTGGYFLTLKAKKLIAPITL